MYDGFAALYDRANERGLADACESMSVLLAAS